MTQQLLVMKYENGSIVKIIILDSISYPSIQIFKDIEEIDKIIRYKRTHLFFTDSDHPKEHLDYILSISWRGYIAGSHDKEDMKLLNKKGFIN